MFKKHKYKILIALIAIVAIGGFVFFKKKAAKEAAEKKAAEKKAALAAALRTEEKEEAPLAVVKPSNMANTPTKPSRFGPKDINLDLINAKSTESTDIKSELGFTMG